MNAHADARPRAEVGAEVDASKGSERRGDMGVCDLRPVKSGGESFHDMNAPPRRQLPVFTRARERPHTHRLALADGGPGRWLGATGQRPVLQPSKRSQAMGETSKRAPVEPPRLWPTRLIARFGFSRS